MLILGKAKNLNMKKILILLIFIKGFTGCVPEDHILEIEIQNNSAEDIKDIRISTADDKTTFLADALAPGEEISHTLKVPNEFSDGTYKLEFYRNNGKREASTGRYLEGEEGFLKKILAFTILEDSVNVQQKEFEVK